MKKCYMLLFTCKLICAIHLGLTTDVSNLPQQMSRKGIPQKMFSDNFKTFKSQKIKRFIGNLQINWEFILECSS